MPSRLCLTLLLACLGAALVSGRTAGGRQDTTAPNFDAALDRVTTIQRQLADLHPAFGRVYPIAVVRDKTFYVYEPDAASGRYRLAKTSPDTMGVPTGVRAAMPLGFWENRVACVVTPDAFDDLRGFILVFHEFVHCYQWETCEQRLKGGMRLYRAAMERKDYMWELQYPFPYGSETFRGAYAAMLLALTAGDGARLPALRGRLKQDLSADEWDYMTWQEWKEGLARYLENKANTRLGQPVNAGGAKQPYSRVTFYAGGDALIRALSSAEPGLEKDMERLYRRIADR